MRPGHRSLPTAALALSLLAALCPGGTSAHGSSGTADSSRRTVLVLHSYHPGYVWTDDQDDGLREGLDTSGYDVDVRTEYLDTKRYGKPEDLADLASHYGGKYRDLRFDLVFCTDDDALAFAIDHHDELFAGAPVVFSGVNDDALARRAPRRYFTGIIEVLSDAPLLDIATRLHPDRTRVVVVGDNSTVGDAVLLQFRAVASHRPGLTFTFLDGRLMAFDAILEALRSSGLDSLVITSSFSRDKDGRYYPGGDANRMIAVASPGPVYSPSISQLGQGIVGGSQSTGRYHGGLAATIGKRILHGASPADIPIEEDRTNLYIFDDRALTRWSVDRHDLPTGSVIVNRPDDFYDRYGRAIWLGILFTAVQTAVIAVLVVNNARRRRAEQRSTLQAETLRTVNRELESTNTRLQSEVAERQRAEGEKAQLHTQLHQSQKMEAVGQLAGGIAHDFNNLLSVILGHVEMALDIVDRANPLARDLQEIHTAGSRAATLTRQLLAFSRKQVLQPSLLDLNEVTTQLETMLKRIIGEHIELRHEGAADLGLTKADRGQLEQVLVNLVVNARDAMPEGGTLTIQTANVDLAVEAAAALGVPAPGPYVRLAVTDTGHGMDADTRARVFEPFFTTKDPGKGTGLGLSMVYGIVTQSGGATQVISEPGKGARFEIYLPRHGSEVAVAARQPDVDRLPTGTETILVVEDEDAVRRLAQRVLAAAGYRVLTAAYGDEALKVSDAIREEIHLLLTDVVMPQMSGSELARLLVARRHAIKVLFMSGYADDAIARHGVLAGGTHMIGKPFSAAHLVRKVREVLDHADPGRGFLSV
jgi:signal transduction histidine kinase/ActR/RegA family two-component response regulator